MEGKEVKRLGFIYVKHHTVFNFLDTVEQSDSSIFRDTMYYSQALMLNLQEHLNQTYKYLHIVLSSRDDYDSIH